MTYVYDSNGNIVSKTPYTNVTSSDLSTATQGTAIVYGYGDGNWSDKLTSYDGLTISYDASGNPTSYRGETVTWNGRLMTSLTKDDRRYEYSYNSDGMRTVKKVYENNELVYTYTYIWDGDVLLGGRMEVTDADEPITIRYLYDDSGELYGMDYNGTGYFGFIKNLQGDIVSIIPLDSESNVEVNMEYDAWGKPIYVQGSSLAEGFMMAVLMAVTNVGYRGYFYDFDTGLYYLRSRFYDPETGRFINADDTDYLGYDKSPLSMNLFAYGCNNAVNNSDPNGTSMALTSIAMAYLFAIVASFFAYAVCNTIINNYNAKFGFQNSWSGFVNALNSYAYSLQYKVSLASNVVWNWTKYRLSTASKAVQLAVTAAKADAAIRVKVRKNSKDRYWSANLSTDHVDIGRALTYKEAINMVKSGKSVFTVTKSEAKNLAKAAYSNKNPVGPEIHNKNSQGKIKKGYFYYHYHVYNRKKPGHIWFLF